MKNYPKVNTTWDVAPYNRGGEYPKDIEKFITFPSNLSFFNIKDNLSQCQDLIGVNDWINLENS